MKKVLFLLTTISLLAACSAYKSSGRKAFEDRASGNVNGEVESPRVFTNPEETCWTQPKKEALWFADEAKDLIVRNQGSEDIEVCTITVNGG